MSTSVIAATVTAAVALAGPLQVSVTGEGHTPKINTHWNYVVRATMGGKPVRGKLTEQIVDPVGGKHLVEFGTSSKKILRWPFNGTFRDFLVFPASGRGIPLTFRVTVVAGGKTKIVNYRITPRG